MIAGENEVLQIFDISFKIVFNCKLRKELNIKSEKPIIVQSIQIIQTNETSMLVYLGTRGGEIIELAINYIPDITSDD